MLAASDVLVEAGIEDAEETGDQRRVLSIYFYLRGIYSIIHGVTSKLIPSLSP